MKRNSMRDIFTDSSRYKLFLLSILIMGLSYGLYKGMLDNFLAEVVKMGEMDRGITEFFREIPGIALVLILAVFCMLSAETLYKAGAIIMLAGLGMHAILPPTKVLATLAICMYSLGEHIQLGMKNTISLQYAKPGHGGAALGMQTSSYQIGTLAGYLVIVFAFSLLSDKQPYTIFFIVAAVLAALSAFFSMGLTGKSETDKNKRRFYFNKKYLKGLASSIKRRFFSISIVPSLFKQPITTPLQH